MSYYDFLKNSCMGIAIASLSLLSSGLTPSVYAQTTPTSTVQSNPKSSVDFLYRGRERFQRKDYKGAVEDFDRAIILNPNDANAYYYRGLLLHELGDNLGAVLNFDRALQLNPRSADAYFRRAGARYSIGDRPGTIQDLQLAAKFFQSQGNAKGYQQAQNLIKRLSTW
ncbi:MULTISPECIES: tetratricopeptide repeat protein [Nostocales]|uniref:Tetratricopeptide repeat protein n=3 Tax=Nostocales TaxID=1161 RepID=A0A8S9SUN1_9CYAN|nr:tetratricopeptide repeat protein [Tolypothrix bouteillei]KAF3884281.1 tetratricopeptide repeat protein [Tolypothrix bouteillei VB521301]